MIFNPLVVVASELGIGRTRNKLRSGLHDELPIVRAYRRVTESGIGSVIVDSTEDAQTDASRAAGAHTVRTDMSAFGRNHNYRSKSGAERIAATVNRFDRFYTHDIVVAVPDDMPELRPYYLQALMYALASTEVGIATLVSPLMDGELSDDEITKATVDWNSDRVVHPLEGSRVGTLADIRRKASAFGERDCYTLVPIHAWRRGALDRLVAMPPSDRELNEGSDLVRALDAGIRIDAALVHDDMRVLLTPEDLAGGEIEG